AELERERIEELSRLLKLSEAEGGDSDNAMAGMSRDGSFETTVSDDGMFMTIGLQPPIAGGEAVKPDTVLAWLREQSIAQGVDVAAIRSATEQAAAGDVVEDVLIVRGRDPKPGTGEKFELFGRAGTDEDLCQVGPEEFVQKRGGPIVCRVGDRVLRRVPPTRGKPGYNAKGEVLEPPAPAETSLDVGPNIRAAGDDYFSEVGGVVVWDGRRIEVRKMLVLSQDVMRTDGPIDFDGDVHARGGVRSGAVIKATGNIQIDGPVEAAKIESTGGEVVLRHGVAGRRQAVIRSFGDVYTRFAENVTIIARGSILIDVGALHCHLTAGNAIRLPRGRGQLLGGVAMAGEVIEAKQLGANSGVVTDVSVGLSAEVMDAIGKVDGEIKEIQQRRDAAAELAEKMKRAIGDPAQLCPDELATYTRLRRAELTCDLKIRGLDEQRQEILEAAAAQHSGSVDVTGQMFPRVIARIGSATFDNRELRRRCRLMYDEKALRIVAVPLR
ncbi:MAG: FapA family protein, partial [Phycisphaeraceae bacterium]